MEQSRSRYQELQLPRSEKKAFDKEYHFKAWGTCVCSQTGRIGSPQEKLRQVETLATELVREGLATKKALQKLAFSSTRSCTDGNVWGFFIMFTLSLTRCPTKGFENCRHM